MNFPNQLPIDTILPELKRALAGRDAAVLQAPPGAGKTTRVPLALLGESWLADRSILMLEPRRLAATNAARYMAGLLNEPVGQRVGYAIRFDRKVSAATRAEVITEGILTRRLQDDPTLEGVGLVIFDEFHERHLQSDLALALCRDAQLGLRPDLKLLVMSATLDAAPISRLLGDAPLITSEGRRYPVTVRYLDRPSGEPVAEATARAVRRALPTTEGDILVFLPGVGEIRRCRELLAAGHGSEVPLVCPLYADLPFAEQERAILPGPRRKVVLATNIAETSLTIEGVTVVVDSGLARQPRFDPATGFSRLETVRISAASAKQRAGRAGRVRAGICFRLWSEGEQGALLPQTPPEIRSADLAPLALDLACWGVVDPEVLCWLDPPPAGALAGGRRLLQSLGALDEKGRVTPLGRRMAERPAHPRLSRLMLEGERRGELPLACDLAALLAERDLLRGDAVSRPGSDSDLLDRWELLERWRHGAQVPDPAACAAADRASRFWRGRRQRGGRQPSPVTAEEVASLLLPAFPDRLARQRQEGTGAYLLVTGRGGRLSPRSRVHGAPFLLALEVGGGTEGAIHLASAVSEALVLQAFAADLELRRRVAWDAREERVVAVEERRLGALTLALRPIRPTAEEETSALLEGVRTLGLEVLNWTPAARQLAARVRFLARTFPAEEWPDLSPEHLLVTLERWLGPFLQGRRSRADLAGLDLVPPLLALLPWPLQRRLDEAAPLRLLVPSGAKIPLDYVTDGPPVLAVKLQELFGLADTPRVGKGRVPVLLHLLSPARRPIQITRDLKNFWDTIYPEVKKELKGRYPKHPWPDDPWKAVPTGKTKPR